MKDNAFNSTNLHDLLGAKGEVGEGVAVVLINLSERGQPGMLAEAERKIETSPELGTNVRILGTNCRNPRRSERQTAGISSDRFFGPIWDIFPTSPLPFGPRDIRNKGITLNGDTTAKNTQKTSGK